MKADTQQRDGNRPMPAFISLTFSDHNTFKVSKEKKEMHYWRMKTTTMVVCLIAFGLTAATVSAAPLMVDFSTNNVPGGDWHSVSRGATFNPIVFPDGTTITFSVESRTSDIIQDVSGSALADTIYEPAARDFYWVQYASGGDITMTISNLDPDTIYTLDVISARPEPTGLYQHRGIFSLNGSPADGMGVGQIFNAYTNGWDAGEVLTWSNIAPNASGELVMSVTVPANSNLFINGLVLTPVPEPATIGLLCIGSLLLCHRGRTGC